MFAPNTRFECGQGGAFYDADWTNQQEGKSDTVPTYAAVTARSYHPEGVQVVMMDGSVHFVSGDIDVEVWQASATRAGGEAYGISE